MKWYIRFWRRLRRSWEGFRLSPTIPRYQELVKEPEEHARTVAELTRVREQLMEFIDEFNRVLNEHNEKVKILEGDTKTLEMKYAETIRALRTLRRFKGGIKKTDTPTQPVR